jgi:serine/threonine-protein kinase
VFSRDGRWIAFSSPPDGWFNVFTERVDGTGQAQRLLTTARAQKPTSWSPDGNIILFNEFIRQGSRGDRDILQVDVRNPGKSRPFLRTSANEMEAVFSPDGRWVAYQSDESGRWEVYVRPYSGPGRARQISVGGGTGAVWHPRGGELFYQSRTALIAVKMQEGNPIGPPTRLFSCWKSEDFRREFDIAPDGQRFLLIEPATQRDEISIITNWFEELKARVPVR